MESSRVVVESLNLKQGSVTYLRVGEVKFWVEISKVVTICKVER